MPLARKLSSTILALALTGGAYATAHAGDAKTIRIEPRAFYGATVSIESGVRVFRPLPSASHVIINPNQTPLNLTIEDVTQRSYSTSRNYFLGGGNASGGRVVGGYLPFVNRGFGRKGFKRGHRHGGGRGGRPGSL